LEAAVSNHNFIAIEAGQLYTPSTRFAPGRVIIENGIVEEVGHPNTVAIPPKAEVIDATQFIVTPGFIDPHIHGCGGADVMEGSYQALNAVSHIVARHGTTSFLPTTVSSQPEVMSKTVERIGALLSRPFDGARPLGIHLEGPFISAAMKGTHRSWNILSPDRFIFEDWIKLSRNSIRLLTLAPELEGANNLIAAAREAGVIVAMGHSDASFEEASAAVSQGVCYAVHTFNAMRRFNHRDPGILGSVLTDDRVFAEIIADGIHVSPAALRLFSRSKGKSHILLVTDAISATDMPDGEYVLGADTIEVTNGVCRDRDGRLAGSTLSQEVALRNFIEWTSTTFEDALHALTLNPAKALHLDRKGALVPGADADLAVLDEQCRVMKTFVGGKLVFDRHS
jgi:N-acetylglucosamine-6-phosphate deacetylase